MQIFWPAGYYAILCIAETLDSHDKLWPFVSFFGFLKAERPAFQGARLPTRGEPFSNIAFTASPPGPNLPFI